MKYTCADCKKEFDTADLDTDFPILDEFYVERCWECTWGKCINILNS